MTESRVIKPRWVLTDVDNLSYGHAKYISRRYNVRIAEVVNVALEHLVEWLGSGGELPDGWEEPRVW